MEREEAILVENKVRLRLILMTAMVLVALMLDDQGRGVFWRRRKRLSASEPKSAGYSPPPM